MLFIFILNGRKDKSYFHGFILANFKKKFKIYHEKCRINIFLMLRFFRCFKSLKICGNHCLSLIAFSFRIFIVHAESLSKKQSITRYVICRLTGIIYLVQSFLFKYNNAE